MASASLSSGNMTPLAEDEMAGVTGAGLAIAAHNFRFQAAPTSYIWVTGRQPGPAAAAAGWQRGDLFYYGTAWTGGQTGAGTGTTFHQPGMAGGSCDQSEALRCPIGVQGVPSFASVMNPYVFRVYEYPGVDYQGTFREGSDMPSVMELIGPSKTDNWRWSFWGEIEVGRTGNDLTNRSHDGAGLLKSQTLIHGSPTTKDGKPAVIRYLRTQQGTMADPSQNGSFGIIYESALSGDFRFSVGQNTDDRDGKGIVPFFNDSEGFYFHDVDAYIPIGRMHYQTLQIEPSGTTGDFILRLTPIAPQSGQSQDMLAFRMIYNEFYCGSANGADCATQTITTADGNSVSKISNPNLETQGYIRWGDFSDPNRFTARDNGISFRNNADVVTQHLGVSRIEGLRIQSMTLTTLGAGGL
ncbi:hypothetical protein S7S_09540 [Isoalcanivorax pacificus W11-5]|uniref:Uncharacterized protein n=1 Tax=Isoalcanivorax pacificus W11-5 TaxID=391936 RepID=A0A0B4XNH7_9GAMM|nr:hypothetical protein S7S_09540 [Isoalcanivorax pacificus W11-5]